MRDKKFILQLGSNLNQFENKILYLFPIGILIVGMLLSALSFNIWPITKTYQLPILYPTTWFFAAVWCILYHCMGMAIGNIWLARKKNDVRGVILFFIAFLLTNFMFLPIANLSNGSPAIMTFMDFNGVFSSLLLGWLCSKYSNRAFLWLLPLIIWMPVTTTFKIMLWMIN